MKMMGLEDASRDLEAESELEKLEQRLGMKPATTTEAATTTVSVSSNGSTANAASTDAPEVSVSEAEKALEELEKRLNNS